MKRKSIFEPVVCPLGQKIITCLGKINLLTNDTPFLRSTLIDYQDILDGYFNDPKYQDVANGIKRQARSAYRSINDRLKYTTVIDEGNIYADECRIQIPSQLQIKQIKGMVAGGEEDQSQRLNHIVQHIKSFSLSHPFLALVAANDAELPAYWNLLFAAIDRCDLKTATKVIHDISKIKEDLIRAILSIHPLTYLLSLINHCIDSHKTGRKKIESDSTVTPKTFEILIKDIASTMRYATPLFFSFGLPTHHAYSDHSKGFCFLNKTAILMSYMQQATRCPIKHLVVGTDVNRDNGLCRILMNGPIHDVEHFDLCDTRVYPGQDSSAIERELNVQGVDVIHGVKRWSKSTYNYYAVALNLMPRTQNALHPSLDFALRSITNCLADADQNDTKVAIFLPTGWDSHQDETAYCGKFVSDHYMSKSEAERMRFNDADLLFFYQSLFTLYNSYRNNIVTIYWGLEGGYEPTLYRRQVPLLLNLLEKQLLEHSATPKSYATTPS